MSAPPAERGYAAALAAVVVWALVPVGTRYFVLRIDPYMFNAIRFAASACAALPLLLLAKPWRWSAADQRLLLGCAVLAVPAYNIPVALGAMTVPAGALGVLIATEPVMIAALALVLERRPVPGRILGGSVIGLLGVALTSGIWNSTRNFGWTGTLQVLAGAFSWSCYTVLVSRLNRRYGALGVTGAIVVAGSVILLLLSLPMMDLAMVPDPTTTVILAAMGLSSSVLGFWLWNYAGAVLPPERLGLFLYMIPLVSVYAGIQFLEESLTLQILAGGFLTLLGVWIATRRGRLPRTEAIE